MKTTRSRVLGRPTMDVKSEIRNIALPCEATEIGVPFVTAARTDAD